MNLLDLAYIPLAIATAPWWARKGRAGWSQRFGRTALLGPPAPGRRRIMLHAVSVGEVNALRTLVPLLTPQAEVVVSATTDTGLGRATELFARECRVVRFPLDFSWSVGRFLDAIRPDVIGLVELEVWPNFIRACRHRRIPVCVINGRLSERSFRGYRRIRRFIRPSFAALEFAAVQDADYAARFEAMGVTPEACLITGSMKWDAVSVAPGATSASEARPLAAEFGIDRERPLIVAGSTGPGEESLLHRACPQGVQLLCAPRKPERFDEAAASLPGCTRRSATRGKGPRGLGGDRFLLDSIGELREAYGLADVVVVGRSFGDLFGSDPIEPIALGRPTVIGPRTSDFAAIVAAFEAAGGILTTTRDRLGADLEALLTDPGRRASLTAAGLECIRVHQGASRRHADLLLTVGSPRE
jgi:3-deoxy-D-manno-octulosonic-acid transferase